MFAIALFPALSVAVIVIVCWAFVSAVKVSPLTERVSVAPSVIVFRVVSTGFPSIFSTTFTASLVRIGHAVFIGEILALRAKIGVLSADNGRLIVNYGDRSACRVRGRIARSCQPRFTRYCRVFHAVDTISENVRAAEL